MLALEADAFTLNTPPKTDPENVEMTYYGYRQEANSNEELRIQLLQGAIKNFNENPTQNMDAGKVYPFEEAFLELMKKADPNSIEKISSALTGIFKR